MSAGQRSVHGVRDETCCSTEGVGGSCRIDAQNLTIRQGASHCCWKCIEVIESRKSNNALIVDWISCDDLSRQIPCTIDLLSFVTFVVFGGTKGMTP